MKDCSDVILLIFSRYEALKDFGGIYEEGLEIVEEEFEKVGEEFEKVGEELGDS